VTGGSKLNSVLIFLHTRYHLQIRKTFSPRSPHRAGSIARIPPQRTMK
jgi:hypothetical protein